MRNLISRFDRLIDRLAAGNLKGRIRLVGAISLLSLAGLTLAAAVLSRQEIPLEVEVRFVVSQSTAVVTLPEELRWIAEYPQRISFRVDGRWRDTGVSSSKDGNRLLLALACSPGQCEEGEGGDVRLRLTAVRLGDMLLRKPGLME